MPADLLPELQCSPRYFVWTVDWALDPIILCVGWTVTGLWCFARCVCINLNNHEAVMLVGWMLLVGFWFVRHKNCFIFQFLFWFVGFCRFIFSFLVSLFAICMRFNCIEWNVLYALRMAVQPQIWPKPGTILFTFCFFRRRSSYGLLRLDPADNYKAGNYLTQFDYHRVSTWSHSGLFWAL